MVITTVITTRNMAKKYIMKLRRVSRYSYSITLPKDLIKEFRWKERQKLEVSFGGRKRELVIRDWKR
jgi:bifunctional DNA-binding transcriptional regulator/antitoxin component of YhaV-PrlF toxin-antitoxin module